MKRLCKCTLALAISTSLPVSATIINIPDDYPQIQQGIDASTDGDTVLVQPGLYQEEVNISGRFVTLASLFLLTGDQSYISGTRIRGNWGTVVRIAYRESGTSRVVGFRIEEGSTGVYCLDANSIIAHNEFYRIEDTGVFEDAFSAGIICDYSNVTIAFNKIYAVRTWSFGENEWAQSYGVYSTDSDLALFNNIIIYTAATSWIPPRAVGFYCENSNSILWNNTIAANGSDQGGGIWSIDSETLLLNDIVWHNFPYQIYGSVTASYCDAPINLPGEGNIRTEPLFRDRENGDFHLMSYECDDTLDSPCIDAGHPEMIDSLLDCSWGLGTSFCDMGAYGGGDSVFVGIDGQEPAIPAEFILSQNYPNPFNGFTVIGYFLSEPLHIRIEIFDVLGDKVEMLNQGEQQAGYHRITWDPKDRPSGLYFYKIRAGEHVESRKMLLLK